MPDDSSDDLSNRTERTFIGGIGLGLPVLLWLIAAWRPEFPEHRWQLLPSISAYYYTGSAAAFVGLLVSLGLFLLSYQGYANKWRALDIAASRIAGGAAMVVAFFPTGAPPGYTYPAWWKPWVGAMHYAGASVLFCSFAFFALYLFRRNGEQGDGAQSNTRGKLWRDRVYLGCGLAILSAIAWIALIAVLNHFRYNDSAARPIFAPECVALFFFATSWLVKGRAHSVVARALIAAVRPNGRTATAQTTET